MLGFIVNIVLLLVVLGLLITIHELGHFIFARLTGTKVFEFAIGMGPVIFQKQLGETKFSIRAFPIGGFVNILGETETDDESLNTLARKSPDSFVNKGLWQKIAILFGGVLFNLMTAVVLYYFLIGFNGFKSYIPEVTAEKGLVFGEISREKLYPLSYGKLAEDSPAIKADFPEMGEIVSIDGKKFDYADDFSKYLTANKSEDVELTVCEINNKAERIGECLPYTVKLTSDGKLGVYLVSNYVDTVTYTGIERVFVGFAHSFSIIEISIQGLGSIFSDAQQSGDYTDAVNSVGGPVALYFILDFVKGLGFLAILELLATLSITLFVMNLLPIPAMDGGRIVLTFVRQILGDRFSPKLEGILISVSFILLMLLMVGIVVKDLVFIESLKNLFGN